MFPPSKGIAEASKSPDFKHAPAKPEEEHVLSKSYRIKKHNQEIIEKDSSKQKLKRCIFKFPSEWGKSDFETRYGWLLQESELGPPMPKGDYEKLKAHQESMAFWEEAGLTGIGSKHWHFPPKEFVEAFGKCLWLSENELVQCIPRSFIEEDHKTKVLARSTIAYANAFERASLIKVSLNRVMRKYLIVTAQRVSQFVANGLAESGYFSKFAEGGAGKGKPYGDWYGRGIIQITHRDNYVKYFKHRGRQINNEAQNIVWRDKVEVESYDRAESAGFWWADNGANRTSDPVTDNKKLQLEVCNDYDWKAKKCNGALSSESRFSNPTLDRVGLHINAGSPTSTKKMNGLPARRDVFSNVQAVVMSLLYEHANAGEELLPMPLFVQRQKK